MLIDDGQIIVLGGLIEDNYGDGVQKVPLLGDIPLIGGLFRYENKNRSKTNLLVFLRPYVMRTAGATDRLTADRYDYMRAQQQGFVSPNIMVRDTNTPLLPPADAPTTPFVNPRTNGPVAGPLPLPQTLPQSAPQPGVPLAVGVQEAGPVGHERQHGTVGGDAALLQRLPHAAVLGVGVGVGDHVDGGAAAGAFVGGGPEQLQHRRAVTAIVEPATDGRRTTTRPSSSSSSGRPRGSTG